MAVPQSDSTLAFITTTVRRLTASPSEASLTSNEIYKQINIFYNNYFPAAIKLDQTRAIYTFFTEPNRDRYPLDVNYNQGIRAPVYVDGILGTLFKDRTQFFNLWPRWPTKFQEGGVTLTGNITAIAQPTNPTQITSPSHNLTTGAVITITGVVGMTQLNSNTYTITIIDANTFSLDGLDNTSFGAYIGPSGIWTTISQTFSFVIQGPFLSKEVIIGGVDTAGGPITINDDGNGNLFYLMPNPVISTPLQNTFPAIPGIYNTNLGNPGLNNPMTIGIVNYVTGQIDFTLPLGISLAFGTLLTVRVSQYQPGRPYCLLFWNNEFTIRPIPKHIHKVEVETYMTPVQFMATTDSPLLNQWALYIAYGVSQEILRQRQDMNGVALLEEGFKLQEGLVLERQGVEEIGQPNYQLFNSTQPYSVYGGWGQGYP